MTRQRPLRNLAGDRSAVTWNEVRPILHSIESNAIKASNAAAMAARMTAQLPARPDFETRAADALSKAEQELRVALSAVKAARERFEKVPVEKLPMAVAAE